MTLAIFILMYLAALVVCSVIAVQKGRGLMVLLGWLLFTPLIFIAAWRIGKPNSSWARKNYGTLDRPFDPLKLAISSSRFPKEAYLLQQQNHFEAALGQKTGQLPEWIAQNQR
jgi:hypothetical protein